MAGESDGIFVDRSRFAPSDKRDMLDDNLLVSIVLHSVLVRTVGVYQADIQRYSYQRDSPRHILLLVAIHVAIDGSIGGAGGGEERRKSV